MNKLLIVHLVDSRKSETEILNYIDTFRKEDGIYHAIIFGGDRDYEISAAVNVILASRDIAYHIIYQDFTCSLAWYFGLKSLLLDSSVDSDWYLNVRDMDDTYDDHRMLESIKDLEHPVGVVRFNHKVKHGGKLLLADPYGTFLSPCEIRLDHEYRFGSDKLQVTLESGPHMIHRQFALVNGLIVKDMLRYSDIYFINQGEDTSFLMRAYVCSYLRKLPIRVCTQIIGIYNRDSGNMSSGNSLTKHDWINRFLKFQTNIGNDCARFLSSDFPDDALPFVHEFVNLVRYERTVGNARSLEYHLRDCPR